MLTPRTELLIDLALEEDLGLGDLTSRALFPPGHRSRGWIEARQDLVVCGVDIAARVFARVDPSLRVRPRAADGGGPVRSHATLPHPEGAATAQHAPRAKRGRAA